MIGIPAPKQQMKVYVSRIKENKKTNLHMYVTCKLFDIMTLNFWVGKFQICIGTTKSSWNDPSSRRSNTTPPAKVIFNKNSSER